MAKDTILSTFLRSIPQSNQSALSLSELAGDNPDAQAIAVLHGYAQLLALLGLVTYSPSENFADSTVIARSQSARYTLHSLASYVDHDLVLIEDWHSRGVEASGDHVLQRGVNFLYAIEQKRIASLTDAQASRQERVAQVLIVRRSPETGQTEILFQYDANAAQYQLIGGRWRPDDGEEMLKTILREIDEELAPSALQHQRDYNLKLLLADIILPLSLSPTFGALTEYHFWIYHMHDLAQPLQLQEADHWVPVEQILAGAVIDSSGRHVPFAQGDLYRQINAALPGGLEAINPSTHSETT